MNRETKRMMERDRKREGAARRPPVPERKKRAGPRQFLREVRQELKKVAWPSRKELISYTLVVLVSVILITSYVFGLDFVISKGILKVFGADTG